MHFNETTYEPKNNVSKYFQLSVTSADKLIHGLRVVQMIRGLMLCNSQSVIDLSGPDQGQGKNKDP